MENITKLKLRLSINFGYEKHVNIVLAIPNSPYDSVEI